MEIPTGEHVEEVMLTDFDPREKRGGGGSGGRHGGEAYHEDDDDDGDGHGPRVQCAHQ